jgi:hypothetical protein
MYYVIKCDDVELYIIYTGRRGVKKRERADDV